MAKRHARHSNPFGNTLTRVIWDGKTIPRVTSAGPLLRTSDVIELREGGSAGTVQTLPGKITWAPFVIRRPVSGDTAFEEWANLLIMTSPAPGNFRKNVRLELHTSAGRIVRAYTLHRCWVQAYEALPTIVSGHQTAIVETLTLNYDGWERDTTIAS